MMQRLRILETNYGREAGWYVEYRGRRIAALIDCRYWDMFWDSYQLEPFTNDPEDQEKLFSDDLWNDVAGLGFVNRELGIAASHAFPAGAAGRILREEGRLVMRGLYLPVQERLWDGVLIATRRWWSRR